jgi:transposase InsO family protein
MPSSGVSTTSVVRPRTVRVAGTTMISLSLSTSAATSRAVGSVGDSYDNALAETIIVEYATLEWVDWFNHRRMLEPIENTPHDSTLAFIANAKYCDGLPL